LTIQSLRRSPLNNKQSLLLKDEATERYISIYIGESEANSIGNILINHNAPKEREPSLEEIDFMTSRLKSIIIDRFVDNVFYTKLIIERDNKCHELRYQTGKAIVSALREGVPILIDEVVLSRAELNSVFGRGTRGKKVKLS
jgi:bifunctional DNase/RNase